jgi:hypothetical protein
METLLTIIAPDPAAGGTILFGAVFFTMMFVFFIGTGAMRAASRRANIRHRILLDRTTKEDTGAPTAYACSVSSLRCSADPFSRTSPWPKAAMPCSGRCARSR